MLCLLLVQAGCLFLPESQISTENKIVEPSTTPSILFANMTSAYNDRDTLLYADILDSIKYVYIIGRNLPLAQQVIWDVFEDIRVTNNMLRQVDDITFLFTKDDYHLDPLTDSVSGSNAKGTYREWTYLREVTLQITDPEKFDDALRALEKIEISIIKYKNDPLWYFSKWAVDG